MGIDDGSDDLTPRRKYMGKMGPVEMMIKQKLDTVEHTLVRNEDFRKLFSQPQQEYIGSQSVTLDQLQKMSTHTPIPSGASTISSQPVTMAISHEPNYIVNESNTHVRYKNTDGLVKVVRKDLIDMVEFDEDAGQAEVCINEYDEETINEKEFIKLCEALT